MDNKEKQKKLFELFNKEFYTVEEIKELLGIKEYEAEFLVKNLKCKEKGYSKLDIVISLMGGTLYAC